MAVNGLYFLHIPRTSGTDIQQQMLSGLNGHEASEEIRWLGGDDFIDNGIISIFHEPVAVCSGLTDIETILISGHLATNPIVEFPFVNSFSIIRNPVARLEGVANYLINTEYGWIDSDEEFEEFFFSNDLIWYGNSYPGFNCEPNIQSKYLTGLVVASRLDDPPPWRPRQMAFNIVGAAQDIRDVIDVIKTNKINISSIENRQELLQLMQDSFFSKFNVDISKNKALPNKIKVKNRFKFSKQREIEIIEENELDFKLYNLVREHERRNGSLFS